MVLWELAALDKECQKRALNFIGVAFIVLSNYVAVQFLAVFVTGHHPGHSKLGIVWITITAGVIFSLAAGKATTGKALNNPILHTEDKVTFINGLLALAV